MIDVPVKVKETLKEGSKRKNYRFLVLDENDETDFVIDNNNLVKESVFIDERMNSGDKIKFGLCEGSSLEFQYFDYPNIKGKRIQAFNDVQYRENPYETVGELNSNGAHYRYDVAEAGDYRIYINAEQVSNVATSGSVSVSHNGPTTYYDMVVKPDGHGEVLLPGLTTIDMIYLWAKSGKYAESTVQIDRGSYYSIPMGFFTVDECPRQASTGIYKITAYNKLMSDYLDAKANNLIEFVETDSDDKDMVSVYAIQKQLLEDYQIEENDGTPITIFTGQSNTLSSIDNGFTFKINGSNTNYYPFIGRKERGIEVPQGKKLKISSLTKYITKLNNQLEQLWQDIRDKCQDAETIISNLKKNTLFQVTCGIDIGFYSYSGSIPNPHYEVDPTLGKIASSSISQGHALVTNVYTLEELTAINNQIKVRGLIKDPMYFTDVRYVCFGYITEFGGSKSSTRFSDEIYIFDENDVAFEDDDFVATWYELDDSEKIKLNIHNIPDVTLRELVTANYELNCYYGKLNRETDLFSGVALNESRLYPRDTLYPANDLYPGGGHLRGAKAMYSKLWADEGNVHKWRYLIITYKGLDDGGNEVDKTLQRTVNADGTDDYNMSDNWLFRNLVWAEEDVGTYADAMVEKMRNMTWFPFEMWCAGLPYIETGDEIEISVGEHTYSSYILQRQLKGIQNLQDTFINGTLDIF